MMGVLRPCIIPNDSGDLLRSEDHWLTLMFLVFTLETAFGLPDGGTSFRLTIPQNCGQAPPCIIASGYLLRSEEVIPA